MDIKTILIINIITNIFLGLFTLFIKKKEYKAIEYWIAINFLLAAGLILILLRGLVSNFFSITIANAFLFSTIVLRYISYKKLINDKVNKIEKIISVTLLIFAITIHTIFAFWEDNLIYRMINYNSYMVITGFAIGIYLLKAPTKKVKKVYKLLGISFFIFAFIYLLRTIGLIANLHYTHFLQSNVFNSITSIYQVILDIFWTITLLYIYTKLAGQAQKQSEDRYKTLSDLTFEGIIIHNQGIGVDVNLAFTKLTGYRTDEIFGKNIIQKMVYPDDIPMVKEKIIEKNTKPYEIRAIKKDGTLMPVELESRYFNYNDKSLRVTAIRDLTLRKEQEAELKAALQTKEILLKEVHHRVKNNLQTIVSLLNQQLNLSKNPDTAVALRDSVSRVMSMALVHQFIYRTDDLENVNMKTYINELINKLSDTYKEQKRNVQINIEVDELFFNIDQTIPIALIINEIISNTFKYAFAEKESGIVNVKLTKGNNGKNKLVIWDNGIGFLDNFDPEKSKSLGMYLIKNFAKRQLKGTLQIISKPNEGVKYEIEF